MDSVGSPLTLLVATVIVFATAGDGRAQSEQVLAKVGPSPITRADIDLALGRAGNVQDSLPEVPQSIVMATVDIVARQRQALETLRKSKRRIDDAEIDRWLLANSPGELKQTAQEALATRAAAAHVSPENYREFLAFRMSWQVYLQSTITEKNLEKHFVNQKPRFDGSRFQVEHISITAPPGASAQRDAARQRMKVLAVKIAKGEASFASAAKELGAEEKTAEPIWLSGNGPLMPTVIDHVLKTPSGSLSQPFDSSQAVHVVKVLAVEPGQRPFDEAKEDVRKHMLLFLLNYLADQSSQQMPLIWSQP